MSSEYIILVNVCWRVRGRSFYSKKAKHVGEFVWRSDNEKGLEPKLVSEIADDTRPDRLRKFGRIDVKKRAIVGLITMLSTKLPGSTRAVARY